MDILAHFLWSFLLFYRTKYLKYALVIGVLPDIFSWGMYMVYRNINNIPFGHPDISLIPSWVFTLYGITHSIIIFALIFILVWKITGVLPVYLGAWGAHIMFDIPSHSREFLATPFLWPVSSWAFPGISWGTQAFMVGNYLTIGILLAVTLTTKKNIFISAYDCFVKK